MAQPLNPKQIAFAKLYAVSKNATQAVRDAGYNMKDAAASAHASRLLKNVRVRAIVEEISAGEKKAIEQSIDNSWVTKARWLKEVSMLAFSDTTGLFNEGETGKLTMSLSDIKKRGLGPLIKKIKFLPNGKAEFELHPKLPALELVAKHHGWVSEKIQFPDGPSPAELTDEDFKTVFKDPDVAAAALKIAEATVKVTKGEAN